MASLTPGVLIKLLKNVNSNKKICSEHRSILLQVISIIPAITGSELFPHHGFFLKVSDSSHSTYVSLSKDDNELILENKLQIGQFIYADKMGPGTPVPVLVGLKLVPGSRKNKCIGSPKDLMQMFGPSDVLAGTGTGRCKNDVKSNEVVRGKVKHKLIIKEEKVLVASKYMEGVLRSSNINTNIIKGKKEIKCEVQPCSSGNKNNKIKVKNKAYQKFERSPSVKNACVKNNAVPVQSNTKRKDESDICWNSLPSSLANSGKRIVQRKEQALLMAAAAQGEATAATMLVKGISLYADLLKSAAKTNLHDSVISFFKLQNILQQTNTILEERDQPPSLHYSKDGSDSQSLFDEIREVKWKLEKESNSWFIKFLEGTIDSGFTINSNFTTTLSLLKQTSLWLDEVQDKEENHDMLARIDLLKRKIYNCLLGYMESAALAVKKSESTVIN